MTKQRNIEPVAIKMSLADADDYEIAYYASLSWTESVDSVEEMRRMIWKEEYKKGMDRKVSAKAGLKQDRDALE